MTIFEPWTIWVGANGVIWLRRLDGHGLKSFVLQPPSHRRWTTKGMRTVAELTLDEVVDDRES